MYFQSMHYILHSIYDQRSPITNKFLYLFLLQSLHDYLCAVHVIRMLHTCYNLPYHRYNHQFVQKLFGVQIRCLFTSLIAFQLVYLLPPHFCVNATHLVKNGRAYTV